MPGDPATALFARFRGKLAPEAHAGAARGASASTDGSLAAPVRHLPGPRAARRSRPQRRLLPGARRRGHRHRPAVDGRRSPAAPSIVSFVVGTLLGVVAAWRRGGWRRQRRCRRCSRCSAPFPTSGWRWWRSSSSATGCGWFPLGHAYSLDREPALERQPSSPTCCATPRCRRSTLVVATLGGWMLGMRNTMIALLGADFIKLARAKGLPPRADRAALRRAQRASAQHHRLRHGARLRARRARCSPRSSSPTRGSGYLLVQAVRNQDYPLMQGLFLVITLAVLAANLLVDVTYVWLDPRTRAHGVERWRGALRPTAAPPSASRCSPASPSWRSSARSSSAIDCALRRRAAVAAVVAAPARHHRARGRTCSRRPMVGARVTLGIGFGVGVAGRCSSASLIGIGAGYCRRARRRRRSRSSPTSSWCIPGLPLAIVIAAYLPPGR